jgi:sporulation protein YlmC with PRC-barrel domain
MQTYKPNLLSTSTLSGDSVRNAQGKDLGKIEDFMIDLDTGRIAYAVLSFGGFLGLGDKLFAIPLDALELDAEHHRFVLDVSKEKLENAPGFDKDNWPSNADASFIDSVYTHYGYEPYSSQQTSRSRRREMAEAV